MSCLDEADDCQFTLREPRVYIYQLLPVVATDLALKVPTLVGDTIRRFIGRKTRWRSNRVETAEFCLHRFVMRTGISEYWFSFVFSRPPQLRNVRPRTPV